MSGTALQVPNLWSTIKFVDEPSPFTRCKAWLERSKGQPIEVIIDCTRETETETSDADSDTEMDADRPPEPFYTHSDLASILDIVSPHVAFWRVFEVEVNDYSFMDIVTKVISILPGAPILEVLQLHHYGEEGDDQYETFEPSELKDPYARLFSGDAPKLAQIALWGVHLDWSVERNHFLTNLRDLELAYHAEDVRPTWQELQAILNGSPEIDTLSLCLSGPRGQADDWEADGKIELTSLSGLVLAFHTPDYVSSLLRFLRTPNINTLALEFEEGDFSSFASMIASPEFGGDSKKSLLSGLEHLKLSGMPCSKETVDVMYEQLGNLTSINLKVFEGDLDPVFFEKLTKPIDPTKTGPPTFYLPHLDTLTTSGVSGKEMRNLIEERKKAGFPIKRVFMSEVCISIALPKPYCSLTRGYFKTQDDDVDITEEVWFREQLETFELFEPSDDEEDLELSEGEMDEYMDDE